MELAVVATLFWTKELISVDDVLGRKCILRIIISLGGGMVSGITE